MQGATANNIYGDIGPKEIPTYQAADVAHYLGVPYHTLYSWLRPVTIDTEIGKRRLALIDRPSDRSSQLSFVNLIEAFVVKALTTTRYVPLNELRCMVDDARRNYGIPRPLASNELKTGFGLVFIERYGKLISLGKGGQLALGHILMQYLERVEFEDSGPLRVFPFVPTSQEKFVSISPYVSFGKPVVSERAIRTSVIAQRYEAGESQSDLAEDYEIAEELIEEAIIYECAA